jgi:hypothetical protein
LSERQPLEEYNVQFFLKKCGCTQLFSTAAVGLGLLGAEVERRRDQGMQRISPWSLNNQEAVNENM